MKQHIIMIPPLVLKALNHVRQHYPLITQVKYDEDQRWLFMDNLGNAPKFGPEIDVSILEDAADSLDFLPITYKITNEDNK